VDRDVTDRIAGFPEGRAEAPAAFIPFGCFAKGEPHRRSDVDPADLFGRAPGPEEEHPGGWTPWPTPPRDAAVSGVREQAG